MRLKHAALAPWLMCACAYQGGSFRYLGRELPGQHGEFGCVDVAVSRRADRLGPVLAYTMGNGCDHAVDVDLGAIPVMGYDDEGRETALVPFDPQHELGALPLDGRRFAEEAIEYRSAVVLAPTNLVCAQPGGAIGTAAEEWLCVSSEDVLERAR